MIPKVIHYCWFGKNNLPELAIKCIESWKLLLPDYEIIEWNEDNFDVNSNQYAKEAYDSKKWAFVSDYVRLHALYNYGGIYMDTDLEVIKNFDCCLSNCAFSGFESKNYVSTAIIGAEKHNVWIKEILKQYENKKFIKEDGSLDLTTNVELITKVTDKNYNIKLNNTYQELNDGLRIYPSEFFYPMSFQTGKLRLTSNTHTIHHFSASWHSEEEKNYFKKKRLLMNVFSERNSVKILGYCSYLKENGIKKCINRLIFKFKARVINCFK